MWQKHCQICLRQSAQLLCEHCWQQATPLDSVQGRQLLSGLGFPLPHLAYAAYGGVTKQWLYLLKYDQGKALAYHLGQRLGLWYQQHWPLPDVLVPVPLYPQRQLERGYNQAEQMARGFGAIVKRPCVLALERQRETPPLYNLNPQERQAALQDAFVIHPKMLKKWASKRILIIDDIFTTGSTLTQSASALAPHSKRLISLTLTRALIAEPLDL